MWEGNREVSLHTGIGQAKSDEGKKRVAKTVNGVGSIQRLLVCVKEEARRCIGNWNWSVVGNFTTVRVSNFDLIILTPNC